MGKKMRLDRILGNMGYGTRKELKKIIKSGVVRVNGTVIKNSSMHIDPYESVIEIYGEKVEYKDYVYLMMNKPKGVISSTYDEKHKTVIDLIDSKYFNFNLFPMGRLDIDTEGLLILTNDGKLSYEILSPKKHIPKTYYAITEGRVTDDDVLKFKKGIILDDGYETLPSELVVLKAGDISEIELTIYEGKFHQVKRMFKSVGKEVKYLKRISMGRLKLDNNLQPGQYRELTDLEIDILKDKKG